MEAGEHGEDFGLELFGDAKAVVANGDRENAGGGLGRDFDVGGLGDGVAVFNGVGDEIFEDEKEAGFFAN